MALLPNISHDIGLSETWTARVEFLLFIIWIIFVPMLVNYVIQITASVLSVFISAIFNTVVTPSDCQSNCTKHPRVTVIVPAYNEEVGILKTIQSVLRTNYPNLQLIIVNDGSTDGTHKKVTDFMSTFHDEEAADSSAETDSEDSHVDDPSALQSKKPEILYLCLENGGKAKAMNTALEHVNGSIVVTVDADSVMDKRAIMALISAFGNDEQVGAVAGNVIVANRSKPIGMIQQLEYLSGFFFKRADSIFGAVYIIGGAAAAYRKNVLDQVGGGFDDSIITEDIELSTRILSAGYKTRYAPNAVIYTEGPSEWTGLCNQRLRWKYGRLETFWKHRNLFFRTCTDDGVRNNWYLTCFLLPLALYGEFLLCMDWFILPFCIFYIFFVNNGPFFAIVLILGGLSLFQIVVDCKRKFHANLVLLVPMTWVAALSIEVVEFQALLRSVRRMMRGEGLKWQKWKRVGIAEQELVDDDEEEDDA